MPTPPRFSLRVILLGALAWLTPGCALVTHGLHQSVAISSTPAGATVLVDDREAGHTPLTVKLTRADSHRIEVRKAGFAPARQNVMPEFRDYAQRKIRFGIDIDSGAANVLTPDNLQLELVPAMLANLAAGDAFEQMSAAVLAADDLQRRGEISEADHHYLIEKILARFAP